MWAMPACRAECWPCTRACGTKSFMGRSYSLLGRCCDADGRVQRVGLLRALEIHQRPGVVLCRSRFWRQHQRWADCSNERARCAKASRGCLPARAHGVRCHRPRRMARARLALLPTLGPPMGCASSTTPGYSCPLEVRITSHRRFRSDRARARGRMSCGGRPRGAVGGGTSAPTGISPRQHRGVKGP